MACQQQKLDAARDAYDKLMTGRLARVVVDSNGEKVEFSAANASRLAAYIKQLEAECAAGPRGPRPATPYGFIF